METTNQTGDKENFIFDAALIAKNRRQLLTTTSLLWRRHAEVHSTNTVNMKQSTQRLKIGMLSWKLQFVYFDVVVVFYSLSLTGLVQITNQLKLVLLVIILPVDTIILGKIILGRIVMIKCFCCLGGYTGTMFDIVTTPQSNTSCWWIEVRRKEKIEWLTYSTSAWPIRLALIFF